MSGIAGISESGRRADLERMLGKIRHRGPAGREILEFEAGTLGVVWTKAQSPSATCIKEEQVVRDYAANGHFAEAKAIDDTLVLVRDQLGVAPLYYGWSDSGTFCFASEVKALLDLTRNVHELPPGHRFDGKHMERYFELREQPSLGEGPDVLAAGLRRRLDTSIQKRIGAFEMGSWLSGGLDSSSIAALARPKVKRLHTFAAGLSGAPDLEHASDVAEFIGSDHHEAIVSLDEMLRVLPEVIYHLESFDALLVRSSILNHFVAKLASDYVPCVFSGEGGDELLAGYEYLKSLDPAALPSELIDIIGRLHNNALQRVDRSASAHGILALVPFADPAVIDYALRLPVDFKLRNGVEKWILRKAMVGALPNHVLKRPKAKFWEGGGVGQLLEKHADGQITDAEFSRERALPNGWTLNTKEELMYYRLFKEHFGVLPNLSWIGRTKGAPTSGSA